VNDVLAAAVELQAYCEERRWRFCFIGGLALLRWGEPRHTADADLTLITGYGREDPFILGLLDRFAARIADAAQFAREHRVLLLRSRHGVGLDISLGALPYEEIVVARSSEFTYQPGIRLRTCSAEDLIVLKAFAGRGQDWVDVERVIIRQSRRLDWDYITTQLTPFAELKGEPAILEALARRRREYED
jgi:hypothetical protein